MKYENECVSTEFVSERVVEETFSQWNSIHVLVVVTLQQRSSREVSVTAPRFRSLKSRER
jgi:hypothetical protein